MQRAALAALTLAARRRDSRPRRSAHATGPGAPAASSPPRSPRAWSPTPTTTSTIPRRATSYYGDTRVALDYLSVTPTQNLAPRPRHRPARALDEAGQRLRVRRSPRRAPPTSTIATEGADTSFDAGARFRSRRVDFFGADRHRRAAARRPDRLPGGRRSSTAPTPTSASPSGPTRRAPTNSASRRPTSTTARTPAQDNLVPRRSVEGARHLDAADHPGLRHRRRPRLLLVLGRQHDRRGDHRRRGRRRDRLDPDRESSGSAAASAMPTASATRRSTACATPPSTTPARRSAATSATSCRSSPCSARRAGPPPRPPDRG